MSFMNKIFGTSKKDNNHGGSANTVPVANDSPDPDGYVHVEHSQPEAPLPYTINAYVGRSSESVNTTIKVTDEIPFQFSPAYATLWSSNTPSATQHSHKLRNIDWDSLCYDFTLEKSITQS